MQLVGEVHCAHWKGGWVSGLRLPFFWARDEGRRRERRKMERRGIVGVEGEGYHGVSVLTVRKGEDGVWFYIDSFSPGNSKDSATMEMVFFGTRSRFAGNLYC